jgi:hypothetical protein
VTAKSLLVAGVATLAIAGAGCSASSTSGPQPPTPINATIVDPTGDTNAGALGTTIYDITGVTSSRTGPAGGTYTTITVAITFVQPVLIPAAGATADGAGTQLGGYVVFDTDGNFANGSNFAFCAAGGGGTYNGADYQIVLFTRLADGNYPIQGPLPAVTQSGEAQVAVAGNTITFTIPISAIGNNPAGPFNLGMALGNTPGPSDCAANSGYTAANFLEHPMSGTPRSGSTAVWGR